MSEQPEPQAGPVVKVARDLTEIEKLAVALAAQAISRANDRLMPGGPAMVVLSPEANLDQWADLIDAAERWHLDNCPKDDHRRCAYVEHVGDEDDQENEDPLRTILFWSEQWRDTRGYPMGGRVPTLLTEAAFIRLSLDWAWDNEPKWDDFAADINRARTRLENILYAGRRVERTRVVCDRADCDRKPRLIKVYGQQAHEDRYKCPACKHRFDQDDYEKAYAKQLRSDGSDKFVPLRDAIATLRAQKRPERTIRAWLAPPDEEHVADGCVDCGTCFDPTNRDECPDCGGALERVTRLKNPDKIVGGYCEIRTRRTWLWWPDLWSRHVSTETRQRSA